MTATIDDIRARLSPALEELLLEGLTSARLIDEAARYHLQSGGKRLRGLLPAWICENMGAPTHDALKIGAGLELLHNATLVHDDLQDGDTHRRGAPAVWSRWGAAQAINVGNVLFFHGLRLIQSTDCAAEILPAVHDAMQRVIEGQALEFQLQLPPDAPYHLPTRLSAWTEMASGKTAALFAVCLRAGVIAAGGTKDEVMAASQYGERVGLLFQVQDDLLDLVGDKGRETPATDIAEGKVSFPVAWAAEHGDAARVSRLLAIVRTPREDTTRAMVHEALGLLEDTGAIAHTIAHVRETATGALANPVGRLVPGLVERMLEPIRHVL